MKHNSGQYSGQWIILSGLILALGLLSLVTLLNQAMSAGHKVYDAEADFASREITEIYEETVRTAKLVWNKAQNKNFNTTMKCFNDNISRIYATHGVILNINVTKINDIANISNISIHYYDGKVDFTLVNRNILLKP